MREELTAPAVWIGLNHRDAEVGRETLVGRLFTQQDVVESTDRGVGPSDLGDLPLEPDRRIQVAAADDDERPHVGRDQPPLQIRCRTPPRWFSDRKCRSNLAIIGDSQTQRRDEPHLYRLSADLRRRLLGPEGAPSCASRGSSWASSVACPPTVCPRASKMLAGKAALLRYFLSENRRGGVRHRIRCSGTFCRRTTAVVCGTVSG